MIFLCLRVLVADLLLQNKSPGAFVFKNQIANLKKGISLCAVEIRSEITT